MAMNRTSQHSKFLAHRRRYYRERYQQRKLRLIAAKDKPCADCGGTFPPECMDFDHVRGRKLLCIGQSWNLSAERLEREIAKCEVVCANCHRIRTGKRRKRV